MNDEASPCWAVWPPAIGSDASEHAMIWCMDQETAARIAVFESNFTGVPHKAVCTMPPANLTEFEPGIFVKDDPIAPRAMQRVRMALKAMNA